MKDINTNAGRHFFYARVSTKEQNLDRQLARAREIGITSDYIFIDKASGKNMERQGLKIYLIQYKKMILFTCPSYQDYHVTMMSYIN